MAYDFTTSPLIRQHFCHFTNPLRSAPPPPRPKLPLHPATLPLRPHLAHSFFFSPPISLPFRHYLSVNTSHCLYPQSKWFLPPGGRFTSTPQTPTDMYCTPCSPLLSFSPSLPLSLQWMRDASWRKQREMGPITALGAESWLINSNSLTNCFFTKNHLSLSHGTHIYGRANLHAQPKKK